MPATVGREAELLAEIQSSIEVGVEAGIIRVRISDEELSGTSIRVSGRDLVNFGTCSYLGLGQDQRLKDAAIAAVRRFGPSYSSSPAYSAVELYTELERNLALICGYPVVPAPTTTLIHLAALPVLVRSGDAVIVDLQAHASLRLATDVLRGSGVSIKTVPHNDMGAAGRAVYALSKIHDRVWLFVDGVYSMFGDMTPVEEIASLLEEFPTMYAYLDDAHGFGWAGEHGVGVVLDRVDLTHRMFVAISLSKAFGAGGGAVVCGDEDAAATIQHTGGTITFGGPIHPAVLGAGIASAAILLSPEHGERQERLYRNIDLVNELIDHHHLKSPAIERTPIFFVEVGSEGRAIRMAKIMMINGFYLNVSSFPIVPKGHSGLRFTVTADHDPADIRSMMATIAEYVNLSGAVDLSAVEVEAAGI